MQPDFFGVFAGRGRAISMAPPDHTTGIVGVRIVVAPIRCLQILSPSPAPASYDIPLPSLYFHLPGPADCGHVMGKPIPVLLSFGLMVSGIGRHNGSNGSISSVLKDKPSNASY